MVKIRCSRRQKIQAGRGMRKYADRTNWTVSQRKRQKSDEVWLENLDVSKWQRLRKKWLHKRHLLQLCAARRWTCGQKPTEKREDSPTVHRRQSDRNDRNVQDYDQGHSDFNLFDRYEYVQLQANANQDNVNVKFNKILLKIGDSHGRSCLCCSLMFLASVKLKRVQRFNSQYLDIVLMRGKHVTRVEKEKRKKKNDFFSGLALDRDLRLPSSRDWTTICISAI